MLGSDGVKGVFAHYMVGGMKDMSRAVADISQAQALGLDAFALNVQHPGADWTLSSLEYLFSAAASSASGPGANDGFKLFFSLDMAASPDPATFGPLLHQYASHPAYYTHLGRPFLSTFRGAAQLSPSAWQSFLSGLPAPPFFVPNFDDWTGAPGTAYTPEFFALFHPAIDGVMGWETAWPHAGVAANNSHNNNNNNNDDDDDDNNDPDPYAQSTTALDDAANLAAARAAAKAYMMPVSSFQSKHIAWDQNWYRRGGLNLPARLAAALVLQPDFVELLTWNDAGEGHYVGNIWPEAITPEAAELVRDYDHAGWQAVVGPFARALKAGGRDPTAVYPAPGMPFEGAFWYRPLLKQAGGSGSDSQGMGKPRGWEDAKDAVNVAVMLPQETAANEVAMEVWSGGSVVASFPVVAGLNMHQVEAIRVGEQAVRLVGADGQVLGRGAGGIQVTDHLGGTGGICNYNYQVVEIVSS
ncbi:glycoside hydrolase [Lasiosphaeris hirsuta]|uniref:Glycoside hydrolase n=1 Tax=Lasiosphaeris hirsuta TaxID=260670 RepID=A0AA40AYK1_9PEZI|nr:glycoside hydrolase [Lasiosphaeris hirsuta]